MLRTWLGRLQGDENVFLYLLGYRSFSLAPPLLALWLEPRQNPMALESLAPRWPITWSLRLSTRA